MRQMVQLTGALLALVVTTPLMAAEETIFSNPPIKAGTPGGDLPWMRLGGGAGTTLVSGDDELAWSTTVQNGILNHFVSTPITLGAGESLVLNFKFRATGLNPSPRAFHVGFFSSGGDRVEGDHASTVVSDKFKPYSGYLAAVNLGGGSGQTSFLYRRNPNTEAVDANNLFGLSTTGVTYLAGGAGYAVQNDEEVEGSLQLESTGNGIKVTYSLNGVTVTGNDAYPVEAIDTVGFLSYGGNAESITFTQCEIRLIR